MRCSGVAGRSVELGAGPGPARTRWVCAQTSSNGWPNTVRSSVALRFGRHRLERLVRPVRVVQLRRPHGEHRAAAEHLDPHAHLEHVRRRRHRHVGDVGLAEQLLRVVGQPGLDRELVDRPGHDVGRAQRERRRDGGRGAEPAGRADPDRPVVAEPRRHRVPQRRGSPAAATTSGRLSVWPPLSASTVTSSATGTRAASSASSAVSWPRDTSSASRSAGAGDMKRSRHLRPGDLGEHVGAPHDPARGIGGQPGRRAAHHRRGQTHERRRGDLRHAVAQQQLGDVLLDGGLAGRVDQVHAPVRQVPDGASPTRSTAWSTAAGDRPAAPKNPSIPASAIAATMRVVAIPPGHLTADVGETRAVGVAERPVAQPFRVQRRQDADQALAGGQPRLPAAVGAPRRHSRTPMRAVEVSSTMWAGWRTACAAASAPAA